MAALADSLSKKHEQELAGLRSGPRFGFIKPFLWCVVGIVALGIVLSLSIRQKHLQELPQLRASVATTGSWTRELVASYDQNRDWLVRRGTAGEVRVYDLIAQLLFQSAASYGTEARQATGVFGSVYSSFHFAVLRISFLIIACWRVWLLAIVLSWLWGKNVIRVHQGKDMLGQTGNGKLYYSGIRAGLDNVTSDGSPDVQVPGLACPAKASRQQTQSSRLYQVLEQYGAVNETNIELASIIIQHAHYPAYLSNYENEAKLNDFFAGATLEGNTTLLLEALIGLAQSYRGGPIQQPDPDQDRIEHQATSAQTTEQLPLARSERGKIGAAENAARVRQALHRVLTDEMRTDINSIPLEMLCTTVLAMEAGKVLAYASEGGHWWKKSNFPQLSARAVLHATEPFGREYNYAARMLIRRAIIFASRVSVMGPVPLPVDLSAKTLALRQWTEVLMAVPPEVDAAADDVEYFGIVAKLHRRWLKGFFEALAGRDETVFGEAIVTKANVLFIPHKALIKTLRAAAQPVQIRRLEQLIGQIHARQRDELLAQHTPGAEQEQAVIPEYRRCLAPLSKSEIASLTETHGLKAEELKDWSALRAVLQTYSWLARRVANSRIPDSSIVMAVFGVDNGVPGRNQLGLIGRSGMVALRTSRLTERFGSHWHQPCTLAAYAKIADSKEMYKRLLGGGSDLDDDETERMRSAV